MYVKIYVQTYVYIYVYAYHVYIAMVYRCIYGTSTADITRYTDIVWYSYAIDGSIQFADLP